MSDDDIREQKRTLEDAEEKMKELEDLVKNTGTIGFDTECVRKKSNWSKPANEFKFDHVDYSPTQMVNSLHSHSPKLYTLFKKIKALDEKDKKEHGKLFKHFIFSDLKMGNYGAKMIASAFIANGYNLGYTAKPNENGSKKKYESIQLYSDDILKKTSKHNFYMLSSSAIYDQNITVKTKKEMLQRFNQRPDNANGDLIRFIILDSGFKEGIDLFDVKYVHIFEPSVYTADQKQVIGRSTRIMEQHPT